MKKFRMDTYLAEQINTEKAYSTIENNKRND